MPRIGRVRGGVSGGSGGGGNDVYWVVGVMLAGLIVCPIFAAVVLHRANVERHAEKAAELQEYGTEATVIGFQEVKNGKYARPYAVVENPKGMRKQVRLEGQPVLLGETWSLKHDQDRNEIVFDTLLRQAVSN